MTNFNYQLLWAEQPFTTNSPPNFGTPRLSNQQIAPQTDGVVRTQYATMFYTDSVTVAIANWQTRSRGVLIDAPVNDRGVYAVRGSCVAAENVQVSLFVAVAPAVPVAGEAFVAATMFLASGMASLDFDKEVCLQRPQGSFDGRAVCFGFSLGNTTGANIDMVYRDYLSVQNLDKKPLPNFATVY